MDQALAVATLERRLAEAEAALRQRQHDESTLRDSEEKYRLLFEKLRESESNRRLSETWLATQKEAFQTAMNGGGLEKSLGVLVRTAAAKLGEGCRCAFYIADAPGEKLHHVVGMSDAHAQDMDIFHCWSFPVETATGRRVGSFAMYFPAPHDTTPRDRALAAAFTHTAGIIISHHQAETASRANAEEAARAHEHQKMLLAELQHRVRNILSVVRSVFSRTAEAGGDIEKIAQHFTGRLDALARTQVILTKSADGNVDLENLIRDELLSVGAAGGGNVHIDGPDVSLKPAAAEMVGMAIHELTTNAIKYGALQGLNGELNIRWAINIDYRDSPLLDLTWTEQGVPAVSIQPTRRGFGRELIEEALPYRLGARSHFEIRGGGIFCRILLPLT